MNLVKSITDQLSSDALAKLCSALGVDGETIEPAITVAVPSMLAGLGGLASDDAGIRKLTLTLGNLDDSMFGNFDRMLSGDTSGILQKGRSLWTGLFGQGLQINLATAISRFTGLSPSIAASLLEYLTPLVIGRVASLWRNQGGTPEAMQRMFVSQERYIDDALPSGFSLDDIRELPRVGATRVSASQQHAAASKPVAKSLAGTLLPLALVMAAVFLVWSYLRNRVERQEAGIRPALDVPEEVVAMKPVAPESANPVDAAQVARQSTGFFQALEKSLTEVEAAPSAEAVLPQLEALDRRIDELGSALARLPGASRMALDASVKEQIVQAKQHAQEVLALPGLNDRLQSLILSIVQKLDGLPGVEPTT